MKGNLSIGVLAVQGAFAEHEQMLRSLGAHVFEIRSRKDLNREFHGLILPGGESTVMGKLVHSLGIFELLKEKILDGLPVFGTCAGLILLAEKLSNDPNVYFGTMPVTVRRNAYGRQLGSFYTEGEMKHIGRVAMAFIRAPYIEEAGAGTEILAMADNHITAVRYENQLATAFHPEVSKNTGVHRYFMRMAEEYCN